jgi:glycerol-3-phosphate dehydrogenase subunit B
MSERGADLIVIGAGLTGLMAAVRGVKAGARVRLIAQGWGQQMVAPGWISVCDDATGDPIPAVADHVAQHPDHPYALAGIGALRAALDEFAALADEIGVPYARRDDGRNLRLPTMLGAIQTPYLAPEGIACGDLTGAGGPMVIAGFAGWRDFHPELVAGNLERQGIAARAIRIDLPIEPRAWDLWPGDLAHQFDDAGFRAAVIARIKSQAGDAATIGFPAVLGLDQPAEALAHLRAGLDRPVFEIPTLPPSVSGTRLSNRLRRWLLRLRGRVQIGHPVTRGIVENGRCVGVAVGALGHENVFYADRFILATGGLYNGGVQSDESGRLWEPIFDLPVVGPDGGRESWYHERLLIAGGHPIHHQTGLRVDAQMRPLDAEGAPALENVYAAGHLLAGSSPLADGCAEGVALATARRAVSAALELD